MCWIIWKDPIAEDLIKLEIDSETQEKMLQNPNIIKTVKKVFNAVGGMQDKVDEAKQLVGRLNE